MRIACTSPGTGSSGCGVGPAGSVLSTNLALLLLGAALWRWRAARRTRA